MSIHYFNLVVDVAGVESAKIETVVEFSRDLKIEVENLLNSDKYKDLHWRGAPGDADVDLDYYAGKPDANS